jgi:hypothetical protein
MAVDDLLKPLRAVRDDVSRARQFEQVDAEDVLRYLDDALDRIYEILAALEQRISGN